MKSGQKLAKVPPAPTEPSSEPEQPSEPAPSPDDVPPLVAATRRELQAADRLDSVAGQQALKLAERMYGLFDTGSAIAALSRELRAAMAEALKDAPRAGDSLDELAERRRRKAAGA